MILNKNSKIYLAGHNGMVGSSILRLLKKKNYKKIYTKIRYNLDLLNKSIIDTVENKTGAKIRS